MQLSETPESVFRWARIQENSDWLWPLVVVALLLWWSLRRYRIDAAELSRWQRTALMTFRIGVLACLFLYYLHPQWEHLVGNSRVAVLLDSSASMGSRDLLPPPNEGLTDDEPENSTPTRLEGVLDWIDRSELIARLRDKHDVVIYSFDRTVNRVLLQSQVTRPDDVEIPEKPEGNLYALQPDGDETRLGEALLDVFQRERGQPLAGVLLISDGAINAGRSIDSAQEIAKRQHLPIYTVGVGLKQQPLNARIANFDVPDRAFPGDPFTVKAQIQLLGGEEVAEGTTWRIPVELWRQGEDAPSETKIAEKEVRIASGGLIDIDFEIRCPDPGKQKLSLKLIPPEEDRNPADDQQQAEVEVVDRKDRVLLFAGGPSRDYQFFCTQIFRDKSMNVDVYLPWAKPGVSQSADKILDRFPSTRTEMAEYDTVVAFDPDWRELSTEQIDVLDFWVTRQGGGLVLFAGPVNLGVSVGNWVTDPGMDKIRAMYPVEFFAKTSVHDHRYHGDEQPAPPKFSRAGEDAEFLRSTDNPLDARTFWNEFPGFYGFFAVKDVKPTATLLASSGSSEAIGRGNSGALVVEQFYGAGRVLYFGSQELWRLRRVDEKAFEQIVTKVLRYVSQGRLQRDSDRGSLATDKRRYPLGSMAQLRATANDAQLKPIEVPTLPLDVIVPTGKLRTVNLTLDPTLPGSYQTHLPLTEEGTWSLQFALPDGGEKIVKTVQVRMGDLERENPSRNEPLLIELAKQSGGLYYDSPLDALDTVKESSLFGNLRLFSSQMENPPPKITELLRVRSQRAVLDTTAEESMMKTLLIALCSLLLVEWTLRRLMKLA